MSTIQKFILVAGVAGLSLSSGTKAEAGYLSNDYAYCFKEADGSGFCQGTLLGFRNSADPDASMYFMHTSGSGLFFSGQADGVSGSCWGNDAVNAVATAAIASKGWAYVVWNANGTCTALWLYNGSAYYF